MVGPVLWLKLANFLSAHIFRISRCLAILLSSSMSRVAFQLFLIRSFVSSFSVSLVSFGVTSWLRIAFLFLDFHIAHIVMAIRVRNLSESLLKSFSNASAGE